MTTKSDTEKGLSLWQIITPVKRPIYMGMALSALSGVTWLAALVLIRPIVQELMAEAPNVTRLWQGCLWILVAILVALVLRILSFRWSHLGAFELEEILRTQLTSHLAKVPLGYVINTGSGPLKKILMDDVRSLHIFLADSTPLLARGYTMPALALILMFFIHWPMALVSLAIFPVGMAAMRLAFTDYAEGRQAYDAANERINRTIVETCRGCRWCAPSTTARHRSSATVRR